MLCLPSQTQATAAYPAISPFAGNTRLTVGDILGLRLQRCHLAVLSACKTAVSSTPSYYASEPVGLTTALLVAGVPRVVSSLWSVDDTATALLITRMYHELITQHGDVSLTAALRNAQIYLRTRTYHEAERDLKGIDRTLATHLQRTCTGKQQIVINPELQLPLGKTFKSVAERVALGKEAFCSESESALRANPGNPAFKQDDWKTFFAAFSANRATFLYSHLFPAGSDKDSMMPERDYWFQYVSDPAAPEDSVKQVHVPANAFRAHSRSFRPLDLYKHR